MRRMLIIGMVLLALGVILGLTVPALSVESEAAGLSVAVDPSEAVDRAEPFAPDAGAWRGYLGDVERIEAAPAAREVVALVCAEPTVRRRTVPVGLRAPDSGGGLDVLDALTL